jgi:hypothetical protein
MNGQLYPMEIVLSTVNLRLGGPQSRFEHFGEQMSFVFVGIRTPDRPAPNLITL